MRTPLKPGGQLVGNVDHVGFEEIRGWACLQSPEGYADRRPLGLEVDNQVVDKTSADGLRIDVNKATGAPERVGFTFRLGNDLLSDYGGKSFRVRDMETGSRLNTDALVLPTVATRTLIDVGDTLIFFQAHGIATGIQRVVTEVTRAMAGAEDVHLVAGAHDGTGVYTVDQRMWDRLLEALNRSAAEAVQLAGQILGGTFVGEPLHPRDGDVLVVLGAPWISELYLQSAIRFRQAGGRLVFMVYDLIPVRLPHMFDDALRTLFTRFLVVCSLVADGVLCISDFTRRDFENYCTELGIEPPPTHVTRLASSLTDDTSRRRGLAGARSPLTHLGPSGYVVLVSTIEGRKGHALLLRVWSRLLREHGRDAVPDLVFVGRAGWRAQDTYSELSRTAYLDGKVHVLSGVSDDELTRLYAEARFTVYPSTYEGWGLPVAESLTCGTPVIASDSTSIPEVGGAHVTYFPSGDEHALYDRVREWVVQPALADRARADLRAYVPDTWADVAGQVLAMGKRVSAQTADHGYAPFLAPGQEVLFGTGATLEDHSSFLEASWQQQVLLATPVLCQPPHTLASAWGNLALRGDVSEPEVTGRWGKLGRPSGLRFRLGTTEPAVVYLAVSSSDDENPVLLTVRGSCRPDSIWCREDTIIKLRVQPDERGEVELHFESQRRSPLEDSRSLGVFFRSMVVVQANDLPGQMLVAEAQAGMRSRGAFSS